MERSCRNLGYILATMHGARVFETSIAHTLFVRLSVGARAAARRQRRSANTNLRAEENNVCRWSSSAVYVNVCGWYDRSPVPRNISTCCWVDEARTRVNRHRNVFPCALERIHTHTHTYTAADNHRLNADGSYATSWLRLTSDLQWPYYRRFLLSTTTSSPVGAQLLRRSIEQSSSACWRGLGFSSWSVHRGSAQIMTSPRGGVTAAPSSPRRGHHHRPDESIGGKNATAICRWGNLVSLAVLRRLHAATDIDDVSLPLSRRVMSFKRLHRWRVDAVWSLNFEFRIIGLSVSLSVSVCQMH